MHCARMLSPGPGRLPALPSDKLPASTPLLPQGGVPAGMAARLKCHPGSATPTGPRLCPTSGEEASWDPCGSPTERQRRRSRGGGVCGGGGGGGGEVAARQDFPPPPAGCVWIARASPVRGHAAIITKWRGERMEGVVFFFFFWPCRVAPRIEREAATVVACGGV